MRRERCVSDWLEYRYFVGGNGTAVFNRCGDFETEWQPKNEPSSTYLYLLFEYQIQIPSILQC